MVDPTGKAAGRGAYLCRRPECWAAALRRDMLAGALRVPLALDDRAALASFAASLAPSAALSGEQP